MLEMLCTFIDNLRCRWHERFGQPVDALDGESVVARFRRLEI